MQKNTNRIAYAGIVIIVLAGIFYLSYKNYNFSSKTDQITSSEKLPLSKYFLTKISDKIGQTYEGYDAEIIAKNFPGIVESDFNNAKARGGIYKYSNNKLVFEANSSTPQSSDSETIIDYDILLNNISSRLNIPTNNYQDIDKLVNQISR